MWKKQGSSQPSPEEWMLHWGSVGCYWERRPGPRREHFVPRQLEGCWRATVLPAGAFSQLCLALNVGICQKQSWKWSKLHACRPSFTPLKIFHMVYIQWIRILSAWFFNYFFHFYMKWKLSKKVCLQLSPQTFASWWNYQNRAMDMKRTLPYDVLFLLSTVTQVWLSTAHSMCLWDGARIYRSKAHTVASSPGSASNSRKPWATVTRERRENPVPLNLMS